ncbi:MAG: hypothetical protein HZB39_02580 [Planctomycetes bacterium]|nr:hypothetical protein [Planctomycetota bacterium]
MARFRRTVIWLCCALLLAAGRPFTTCGEPSCGQRTASQSTAHACCCCESADDAKNAGTCDCERKGEREPTPPPSERDLPFALGTPESRREALQPLPEASPAQTLRRDAALPRAHAMLPHRLRQEALSIWRS